MFRAFGFWVLCLLPGLSLAGPTLVWSQRYDEPLPPSMFNGQVVRLISDSTGDFYVNGLTDNGGEVPFIAKYSSNGNMLWAKILPLGCDYIATSSTRGHDGSFYVAYRTLEPNGSRRPTIWKVDPATGSVIWQKTLTLLVDYGPTTMHVDFEGHLIAMLGIGTTVQMVRLDKDTGAQFWQRDFGSSFGNPAINEISLKSNAALAKVSALTSIEGSALHAFINVTTGVVTNISTVGIIDTQSKVGHYLESDGRVFCLGFLYVNGLPSLVLKCFGATGTLLWTKFYTDSQANMFAAGDIYPFEGDLLLFGTDRQVSNGAYWTTLRRVLKTNGNLVSFAKQPLLTKFRYRGFDGNNIVFMGVESQDRMYGITAPAFQPTWNHGFDFTNAQIPSFDYYAIRPEVFAIGGYGQLNSITTPLLKGYDTVSGDAVWEAIPTPEVSGAQKASSVAILPSGSIVTLGSDSRRPYLMCHDPQGTLLWKRIFIEYSSMSYDDSPYKGNNGSILVVGDLGTGNDHLVCVDGQSGINRWAVPVYGSSTVFSLPDGNALVWPGVLNNTVAKFHGETGAQIWSTPCSLNITGAALNETGQICIRGVSGTQLLSNGNGSVIWEDFNIRLGLAPPVFYGGDIYCVRNSGGNKVLSRFSLATRQYLWDKTVNWLGNEYNILTTKFGVYLANHAGFSASTTRVDLFDFAGDVNWTKTNSLGSAENVEIAMQVDAGGDLYAAYGLDGVGKVLKFHAVDGSLAWSQSALGLFDGPWSINHTGGGSYSKAALAISPSGRMILASDILDPVKSLDLSLARYAETGSSAVNSITEILADQSVGDQASLTTSDDNRFVLTGLDSNDVSATIEATSPLASPYSLRLEIEASANRTDAGFQVELYNYPLGTWQTIMQRQSGSQDKVFTYYFPKRAERFVEPVTRKMKVRVRAGTYYDLLSQPVWSFAIDRIAVNVATD